MELGTKKQQKMDITANRQSIKWSRWEITKRVFWMCALPLFRLSPRPMWAWRRSLLRLFGARVEPEVHIYPTVKIAIPWNLDLGHSCAIGDGAILYSLGCIKIGARATVSQGAHLCAGTHDITCIDRPLMKMPIVIGADSWIAADSFIGPGVAVGNGAIVGARAVAMKDIAQAHVVAGNPIKTIRVLDT